NIMEKQHFNTNDLYNLLHTNVEGMEALVELALNIRWSWNHAADALWQQLNPDLWELTHNPWIILQTASRDELESQLADPEFKNKIDELMKEKEQTTSVPAWYQEHHPKAPLTCAAYFSMEYML